MDVKETDRAKDFETLLYQTIQSTASTTSPDRVKRLSSVVKVILFDIPDIQKRYYLELSSSTGILKIGTQVLDSSPMLRLSLSSDVFHNIALGYINPAVAFVQKKVVMDGIPLRKVKTLLPLLRDFLIHYQSTHLNSNYSKSQTYESVQQPFHPVHPKWLVNCIHFPVSLCLKLIKLFAWLKMERSYNSLRNWMEEMWDMRDRQIRMQLCFGRDAQKKQFPFHLYLSHLKLTKKIDSLMQEKTEETIPAYLLEKKKKQLLPRKVGLKANEESGMAPGSIKSALEAIKPAPETPQIPTEPHKISSDVFTHSVEANKTIASSATQQTQLAQTELKASSPDLKPVSEVRPVEKAKAPLETAEKARTVSETSKVVPEAAKVVPEVAKLAPETPKVVPEAAKLAPETPKIVPETAGKKAAEMPKMIIEPVNEVQETSSIKSQQHPVQESLKVLEPKASIPSVPVVDASKKTDEGKTDDTAKKSQDVSKSYQPQVIVMSRAEEDEDNFEEDEPVIIVSVESKSSQTDRKSQPEIEIKKVSADKTPKEEPVREKAISSVDKQMVEKSLDKQMVGKSTVVKEEKMAKPSEQPPVQEVLNKPSFLQRDKSTKIPIAAFLGQRLLPKPKLYQSRSGDGWKITMELINRLGPLILVDMKEIKISERSYKCTRLSIEKQDFWTTQENQIPVSWNFDQSFLFTAEGNQSLPFGIHKVVVLLNLAGLGLVEMEYQGTVLA